VTAVLVGTNDGITVLAADGGSRHEIEDRSISALARDGRRWLAIADDRTILRREPDGSWTELAVTDDRLTCVCATGGGAFAGTAAATLVRTVDGRALRVEGFDAVDGRDTWHAVGSSEPYVRSVTTTVDGRAVLANVHVGGIPRSGNGGATWVPTIEVDADVHEVRAHPTDPMLVIAAAAVGVAESRDAGSTWSVTTDDLHASYCRAVAFTSDAMLVSASDGPFTERGALYRRELDDGPLTKITAGLPEWLAGNVDTGHLDAAHNVAAFADEEALYRSDDAGTTWQHRDAAPPGVRAVAVAPD